MLSFDAGYMWFQIDSGLSEEVSIAAAACGIQRDERFLMLDQPIRDLEIFKQMA